MSEPGQVARCQDCGRPMPTGRCLLPSWRIECPACGAWLVTHLRDDVTRFLDAHNYVSPPSG